MHAFLVIWIRDRTLRDVYSIVVQKVLAINSQNQTSSLFVQLDFHDLNIERGVVQQSIFVNSAKILLERMSWVEELLLKNTLYKTSNPWFCLLNKIMPNIILLSVPPSSMWNHRVALPNFIYIPWWKLACRWKMILIPDVVCSRVDQIVCA